MNALEYIKNSDWSITSFRVNENLYTPEQCDKYH